jgi:hypothetical protein
MESYKSTYEFKLIHYIRSLVFFLKEMIILVSAQIGSFTDKTIHLAEATFLKSLPNHIGVCDCQSDDEELPELCKLIREVYPGERVVEPVFVRNIGNEPKEFQFQSLPLTDTTGQTLDTPVLSLDKVTLQPDEKVLLTISYETAGLQAGLSYTADILVKGYCEQKISLIAHVFPLNAARCTMLQKKVIRPHTWRDHFHPHEDIKKENVKNNGKGKSN